MIKCIPGLLGAIIAFIALQFLDWLEFWLRLLVVLAIYLFITISIDQAMTRYGKRDGG